MNDPRVVFLAVLALVLLLVGLIALALPDPYEGQILVEMDPAHSLRSADIAGLGLVLVGGVSAWGAGWLWRRRILS